MYINVGICNSDTHRETQIHTHAHVLDLSDKLNLRSRQRERQTHTSDLQRANAEKSPSRVEKSFAFTLVWSFVLKHFVRERGFIVHWWTVVSLCYYILRCGSILCRVYLRVFTLIQWLCYMFSFLFPVFVSWPEISDMAMIIMPLCFVEGFVYGVKARVHNKEQ